MISKPYYQITLKAVDCRFSLTVNDQFVFQMNVENGFVQMELPEKSVVFFSALDKKASLRRLTGEPAWSFNKEEPFEQLFLDLEFYWSIDSDKLKVI